jgi:hypothetical protein
LLTQATGQRYLTFVTRLKNIFDIGYAIFEEKK